MLRWAAAPLVAYAVLVAASLLLRPLLPVDETRYASVAWEMWSRGDWLVPHLNGQWYDHKPPLLFWLIHAGWALAGVNDWWPRVIGPGLTLLNLALLARLADRLWPLRVPIRWLAPAVFLGSWYIAGYSTALMFDMLLLACVLGAWHALWHMAQRDSLADTVAFGLCLGLGLLAKGPVALVYTVPLAILARYWAPDRKATAGRWTWRVLTGVLLAAALPLAWVAAVAQSTDGAFVTRLLVDQTLDRVSGTIGHGRPWWWYLKWLPLVLLPWILWPPVWRAWRRCALASHEPGVRFALSGIAASAVILSLVGGKQVHYLVPLVALWALLTARLLVDVIDAGRRRDLLVPALVMSPLPLFAAGAILASRADAAGWATGGSLGLALLAVPGALVLLFARQRGPIAATLLLCTVSISFCACLFANAMWVAGPRYDLTTAARVIAARQAAGDEVATLAGTYQGEFNFLGRLREPITVLKAAQVQPWLETHPEAILVARTKRLQLPPGLVPLHSQPYKSDRLVIVTAAQVLGADVTLAD